MFKCVGNLFLFGALITEKFLVRWKGYTAEKDTWENRKNLENAKELVEEFKREYREEVKELRQ